MVSHLLSIQNELFDIGAELASEKPVRRRAARNGSFHLDASRVQHIERLIDEYDAKMPALRTFILPGGSSAASALHVARTTCRRAEREVVRLAGDEPVNPAVLTYVNRLCDLLFAMARYANKVDRRREVTWQQRA
jgi:cob(I)alamin adenosyltransferase